MYKEVAEFVLNGRPIDMTLIAARAYVQDLNQLAERSHRDEAEHVARSGWIMIQFVGDRKYDVYNHLYLRFGVSPQRGKRMRRYAEKYIDPTTGSFNEAAWAADRTGETRRKSEAKEPDANDVPVTASQQNTRTDVRDNPNQMDHKNHLVREEPNKQDDSVGGRFAERASNPIEDALNDLPLPVRSKGPKPEFRPGYVAPPAGCVGATQPELPWHLAESARTLADRAAEFEQAVERGEVDSAFAHDIQARIDGLLTDLAAAKAGAK